jgi:hypothetical protein
MNYDNLFANKGLSPSVQATPVATMVEELQAVVNRGNGQFASAELAKSAISMEGFTSEKRSELQTAVQNLDQTIRTCCKVAMEAHGGATRAQLSASITAGIMGANPQAFFQRGVASSSSLKAAASDTTTVFGNTGIDGAMESRAFAMEAFDNKENKNAMVYSVAYNMQAARQDEFGEGFFPTIVVTPDNVGFMVSIRLIYVQEEVRRSLSGSLSNFGRKNVLKAVIDPTILRNDQTRIIPVVRTGGGANDSQALFVASSDVAPYAIVNDNASVTTAPLIVGAKIELLGISQTAAMIAANQLDQTDALDSSVRLGAVYVKIPLNGANPAKVTKFSTDKLPLSDFNAAVQGNTRMLQLNFQSDSLKVTSATTDTTATVIPQLSGLTDKTVRLSVTMFGSIIQDTAITIVNAGAVTVTKITDSAGLILDQTSGTGATIAALFAGATVVGYDLIAYRVNSNRRQRGQLIDTQFVNHLYTVPLLPPITALRPVGETEANDANLISALVTTTRIRTSNAAVTTILEARQFLKDYVNSADLTGDTPEILGVARYLVTPVYLEETLDMATAIDSLKSSDRAEDVVALLINKIRDVAIRMYTTSGYKAASDALFDGAAPKPMVIIGTDLSITRYLTLNGDMRTLGDFFDFKLVSTQDNRMTGKIMISFGMESSYNSGVPNPLHFGSMAFKPELTLMMPIVRNGATTMELTVQPSFRHVVNLPILSQITVANLSTVMATKVSINQHIV